MKLNITLFFMAQNRFCLVVLLFIPFLNTPIYAQKKIPSKKEIALLVNDATKDMTAGRYEKSLIKSRLALHYAIATKDNSLIGRTYNVIGTNFDQLTEFEKAYIYYKKGIYYANKTKDNVLKNWLNNNLGNIYCFNKKEYQKGIYYYKKSLEYSIKAKDSNQVHFTKLNIAWAYFDIGEFKKGLPYLKFINEHQNKDGDASTIVALNMLNGMYSNHKEDHKKADFYFQNAIQLGTKGDEKSDLSFTHQEYSKFLLKTGNYQKAYEQLALFNKITNELNTEEKLKKANVVGINLELDDYKRQIDKIETEYKTKQNKLIVEQSRNKKIITAILFFFIFTMLFFYFFYQNTKLKQKNKLSKITSKIQENTINATIDGQELERKKIASFLHDNISALLSAAGMHLNVFSNQNESLSQEIIKTKSILKAAHDKIRDLSHELLPSVLIRFGLFFALEDLCEKNSNSNIHFHFENSVGEKTRYNEEFEMKMYFIISELLNNIIKHSEAKEARLTVLENNEQLQITVFDNGKGFDTNQFHILEGFGLNQIRSRIQNMLGNINFESIIDLGTIITIKAPIQHK